MPGCINQVSTLHPHVAFLWYFGQVSVTKMPSRCHHCYYRSNPGLEYLNWKKKRKEEKNKGKEEKKTLESILWGLE